MKLVINEQIFTNYPDVNLGVLAIHNLNNEGNDTEITSLLREAEKIAIEKVGDTSVIEHPNIVPWRDAYNKFGAKPKKYPSSIENLVRRILNGEQVRHINKLVDIYNIISLKYLLPVGGEDLDKVKGDIKLTIATENEEPVFLLGERDARPPYPNEVIYKDDIGTICRRWNWKEAERTKLTEQTKQAVIVIESLPTVTVENLTQAITELEMLIKKFCGGTITTSVLNKENSETKL